MYRLCRRYFSPAAVSSSNPPFKRILIANRGEIACRVIRTCRKMGIETVAIHSEADTGGLFVDMADYAVCVGPAASAESYLKIDRIVDACKMTGAEAVHPGFGFLSENTDFAAALEKAGIVFIGPGSHAISVMGDKITSKKAAKEAGVNVIPGDNRIVEDLEDCLKVSNELGYPVMVKASAGGGGKGMRIAYDDNECKDAFRISKNEALSSFGDDRLFVEKFIEEPRHVEIQVLADTHGNVIYLNERECSIQRRNQKIYEEAPSPASTPELRAEMGRQACQLARAVDYVSAGTCEFLVDAKGQFYFLEMNTRLQVEHPITEMITGVDLVEQMIKVAAGEKLAYEQKDIGINGWSFEARVYAEDPFRDFLPQVGLLKRYREPTYIENVRCDSGIRENAEISVHYDPMISKLVTWGPSRDAAMDTMRDALDSYVIQGVRHNIPFLRSILDHSRFKSGAISTNFIAQEYPDGFGQKYIDLNSNDLKTLVSTAAHAYRHLRRDFDGQGTLIVSLMDEKYRVACSNDSPMVVNGETVQFETNFERGSLVLDVILNGESHIIQLVNGESAHQIVLQFRGMEYVLGVMTEAEDALWGYMPVPEVIDEESVLIAPMPGNVFSLSIKEGDAVKSGQEVCILEAMKMQNLFYAQKDGVVKKVHVKQGAAVQSGQIIYELE